ncbi:conserved hypothetical protein [Beggiatoa sp. PS]|nr:conserved hypothetical protein [Beggiatoa sp. PS]
MGLMRMNLVTVDGELELDEELPELEFDENNFPDSQLEDIGDYEEISTNTIPDDIEVDSDQLPQNDNDIEINEQQLIEIFKQEAEQHLITLKNTLSHLEKNLPCLIETDIVLIFHTLNGSSRCVNLLTLSDIAAPMEDYARALQEQQTLLSTDILTLFNEATHLIENLLHNHSIDKAQPQILLNQVQASLESLCLNKSPTDDDTDTFPIEDELEEATDEFKEIFLEEADGILENTQSLLERWKTSPEIWH